MRYGRMFRNGEHKETRTPVSRRQSKAAALPDQEIGSRHATLSKKLFDAAGEVRPSLGFGMRRLRNDTSEKAISFVELRHRANVSPYPTYVKSVCVLTEFKLL